MIMLVDASGCTVPFASLASELAAEGESRGLQIRIQREDIFNAMHRNRALPGETPGEGFPPGPLPALEGK